MRLFLGTVGDYLRKIDMEKSGRDAAAVPTGDRQDGKKKRKEEHLRRKEQQRRVERLTRELRATEEIIASLEKRKDDLEKELSSDDTCSDPARVAELSGEYGDLTARLNRQYGKWERLQEELDTAS